MPRAIDFQSNNVSCVCRRTHLGRPGNTRIVAEQARRSYSASTTVGQGIVQTDRDPSNVRLRRRRFTTTRTTSSSQHCRQPLYALLPCCSPFSCTSSALTTIPRDTFFFGSQPVRCIYDDNATSPKDRCASFGCGGWGLAPHPTDIHHVIVRTSARRYATGARARSGHST